MTRRLVAEVEAFLAQSAALVDWLSGLTAEDFAAPTVLGGWDVRTLVGHVVHLQSGLGTRLRARSSQVPFRAGEPIAYLIGMVIAYVLARMFVFRPTGRSVLERLREGRHLVHP